MLRQGNEGTTGKSAILLIHCEDRCGLVASVAEFINDNRGNVIHLDQHVDKENKVFFMRIEWEMEGFSIPAEKIGKSFEGLVAQKYGMSWRLHFSSERPRVALYVSRLSHCLFDLLAFWRSGGWAMEIPLIVSNHGHLQPVAEMFGIEFHQFTMTAENRQEQEEQQLALLEEQRIDLVVLARYMQILSGEFVQQYSNRIINIHHSFLPAFPGAKPYHSAYARGVKIIGATSHYVTAELDAGPIIEQDVTRVGHKDSVADLVRKGQELEKNVLSRAVWAHLRRQVLVYGNRTVVFS